MGKLYQHSGSISRLVVASASPSVVKVEQDLQAALHNVVGRRAVYFADKADAARIVLQGGIKKTVNRGGIVFAHEGRGLETFYALRNGLYSIAHGGER